MITLFEDLNWRFHHIGVAVWNIEASREIYRKIGYSCGEILHNTSLNVKLSFCRREDSLIELVAPVNEKSPCMFYLKRMGPGTYHTCYRCDDLDKSLKQLKINQIPYKVIARPSVPSIQPQLLFLLIPDCGMVELLEKK